MRYIWRSTKLKISPDHSRLLSTITGYYIVVRATIMNDQIFTKKDGRAVIKRIFERSLDEKRQAHKGGKMIQISKLIEKQTTAKQWIQVFSIPSMIQINNPLSDYFTVIEIESLDRPGLLLHIINTIAHFSLGEKMIDTFYITDCYRKKIKSPQKLVSIRLKLMAMLEGIQDEGSSIK
ncbi:hypothetical protein [Candidatus Endowatersipora endosymbiont of Watersipora subatra]|uniref:hypothetical protein n=1 Tax=Candidatus Endowatersipora endosymbiont of Watersipora subatra TaxID=3077946 RepID=UPI00312CB174